jgi:hypothetical protein
MDEEGPPAGSFLHRPLIGWSSLAASMITEIVLPCILRWFRAGDVGFGVLQMFGAAQSPPKGSGGRKAETQTFSFRSSWTTQEGWA